MRIHDKRHVYASTFLPKEGGECSFNLRDQMQVKTSKDLFKGGSLPHPTAQRSPDRKEGGKTRELQGLGVEPSRAGRRAVLEALKDPPRRERQAPDRFDAMALPKPSKKTKKDDDERTKKDDISENGDDADHHVSSSHKKSHKKGSAQSDDAPMDVDGGGSGRSTGRKRGSKHEEDFGDPDEQDAAAWPSKKRGKSVRKKAHDLVTDDPEDPCQDKEDDGAVMADDNGDGEDGEGGKVGEKDEESEDDEAIGIVELRDDNLIAAGIKWPFEDKSLTDEDAMKGLLLETLRHSCANFLQQREYKGIAYFLHPSSAEQGQESSRREVTPVNIAQGFRRKSSHHECAEFLRTIAADKEATAVVMVVEDCEVRYPRIGSHVARSVRQVVEDDNSRHRGLLIQLESDEQRRVWHVIYQQRPADGTDESNADAMEIEGTPKGAVGEGESVDVVEKSGETFEGVKKEGGDAEHLAAEGKDDERKKMVRKFTYRELDVRKCGIMASIIKEKEKEKEKDTVGGDGVGAGDVEADDGAGAGAQASAET